MEIRSPNTARLKPATRTAILQLQAVSPTPQRALRSRQGKRELDVLSLDKTFQCLTHAAANPLLSVACENCRTLNYTETFSA